MIVIEMKGTEPPLGHNLLRGPNIKDLQTNNIFDLNEENPQDIKTNFCSFGSPAFSIMTFNITALCIMTQHNDIQHRDTQNKYKNIRVEFCIVLSVSMLNVVKLFIVMLSVVAPIN
jgi:hypothetical protein